MPSRRAKKGELTPHELPPVDPDDGTLPPGRRTPVLDAALAQAVMIPSAAVRAHVDSVRRRNPGASPAQVVQILEREFLTVVSATGGAVGVAAAVPAVGTTAGIVLTSSDIATFFASAAAFALAVAEVHGIAVEDVERRRALLLVSVLGDRGARDVERAAGGSPMAWGKVLLTRMPQGTLRQVNRALSHRFVKTQLAKQGGMALGRVVPFGIGAAVGFLGGRALGRGVIKQTQAAFGPPPQVFGRVLEVVEVESSTEGPRLVETRPAPRRRGLRRRRADDQPAQPEPSRRDGREASGGPVPNGTAPQAPAAKDVRRPNPSAPGPAAPSTSAPGTPAPTRAPSPVPPDGTAPEGDGTARTGPTTWAPPR
ncbi:hypothetical protein GCM10025865_19850 [Paraoerskovia sediminicola]|uniref:EcsC protein family protein n=1 Tax=Paraoerskovia sediminicola TaxID=1138587 RepID=A0ABN6XCT4_9CELL|nr:hypothetical protein [Paraoerskovia sediminicola]BDZ42686.1 hypothetical protein GCM10025865_19850 [Paraoerskovia sediminicola]